MLFLTKVFPDEHGDLYAECKTKEKSSLGGKVALLFYFIYVFIYLFFFLFLLKCGLLPPTKIIPSRSNAESEKAF